jgi:hypothetical protein
MVSSGTLSSAATSSVVKRASSSAPASSPDSGTSTGAIVVGGQFGSGQDHITGISRSYGSAGRATPLWTGGLGVLAPLLMLMIAVSGLGSSIGRCPGRTDVSQLPRPIGTVARCGTHRKPAADSPGRIQRATRTAPGEFAEEIVKAGLALEDLVGVEGMPLRQATGRTGWLTPPPGRSCVTPHGQSNAFLNHLG